MKKVVMSLAIVCAMFAFASCSCCNNCKKCDSAESTECTKCDSTKCCADSTACCADSTACCDSAACAGYDKDNKRKKAEKSVTGNMMSVTKNRIFSHSH